jgi:hypothetical protein
MRGNSTTPKGIVGVLLNGVLYLVKPLYCEEIVLSITWSVMKMKSLKLPI